MLKSFAKGHGVVETALVVIVACLVCARHGTCLEGHVFVSVLIDEELVEVNFKVGILVIRIVGRISCFEFFACGRSVIG